MNIKSLNRKLNKKFAGRDTARLSDGCIVLTGELDDWNDVVDAGMTAATPHSSTHVVNDIVFTAAPEEKMHVPALSDNALEGDRPDVLVIGGGISGCSAASCFLAVRNAASKPCPASPKVSCAHFSMHS